MKKKSPGKKMAKQPNSYSENFIKRLRHSRKSQLLSMLVVGVALVGIYLVIATLAPVNHGENTGRLTLQSRGDSIRERISLRIGSIFNRLSFIIGNKRSNPEFVVPANLPAPPDEVKLTLPDPSIFGNVDIQSPGNLSEEIEPAIINTNPESFADQTDQGETPIQQPESQNQSTDSNTNNESSDQNHQPHEEEVAEEQASFVDNEDFGETYGEPPESFDQESLNMCVYEQEA